MRPRAFTPGRHLSVDLRHLSRYLFIDWTPAPYSTLVMISSPLLTCLALFSVYDVDVCGSEGTHLPVGSTISESRQ